VDTSRIQTIRQKLLEADTPRTETPLRITDDEDTITTIERFAALYSKIQIQKKSLKASEDELKTVAPEIFALFEQVDTRLIQAHNVSLFLRKEGYTRETFQYKEVLMRLFERIEPDLKAYAEQLLETSKKVSNISPEITASEVEVTEAVNLAGFKRLFREIIMKVTRIQKSLSGSLDQFWKDIEGFDGLSYLKGIQVPPSVH
jgi:hypothetical protein